MYTAKFMGFLNAATNASLLGVLLVGGNLISKGKMTAGDLTKFALRSVFVGLGFSGLSRFYSDMNTGLDAAARVFDAVDHDDVSTTSGSSTTSETPSAQIIEPDESKGRLVFENVSFSYKPGDEEVAKVLNNFCH